jgi:hypothetical protein
MNAVSTARDAQVRARSPNLNRSVTNDPSLLIHSLDYIAISEGRNL